eukprot:2324816-Prymnesium_polylepis.1
MCSRGSPHVGSGLTVRVHMREGTALEGIEVICRSQTWQTRASSVCRHTTRHCSHIEFEQSRSFEPWACVAATTPDLAHVTKL